ncbi:MAG: hypothetical protein FJX47_00295 [Alphaproteobacteria bacterium]|nr:hypothetical protein [Alphaproteobacteria bacterium]
MSLRSIPMVLSLVLALGAARAEGYDWIAGLEDLPLMPGLIAKEETALVFDKPDGRIVEIDAFGGVARAEVEKFYGAALPSLGWTKIAPLRYRREGEVLTLAFHSRGAVLEVRFSIKPE